MQCSISSPSTTNDVFMAHILIFESVNEIELGFAEQDSRPACMGGRSAALRTASVWRASSMGVVMG